MKDNAVVCLASRSTRRRELLQQIAVNFRVVVVYVDERRLADWAGGGFFAGIALEKACAGRLVSAGLPVLGADTAVVCGDDVLGKPADRADAMRMLQLLSGRTHQVLTAVALADGDEAVSVNSSSVTFRTLTEVERAAYWASGEPADKAGGDAIQGLAAMFISRIEGSYSGVMGLPLYETAALLQAAGIDLLSLD